MKVRKGKKGFLLAEETLKMIVALICIIFLVYIIMAIYNASTIDKKMEAAKGDIGKIREISSSLNEGESQSQDIPDPSGWHIYTFVGQEKPNSCLNTNCVCVCKKSLVEFITSQTKKCDSDGACLPMKNLASSTIDLKIRGASNLLFINIKNQNGRIFVEEKK